MMGTLWNRIARSLPPKWLDWSERYVPKSGWHVEPQVWLGQSVIWSILGGILGALAGLIGITATNAWLESILPGTSFSTVALVVVGLFWGMGLAAAFRWLQLYYAVEARKKKVEEILPDFLLLVAGNIRAGMTSFSAFKSSARPEFGALAEEIRTVTNRSLGTASFGNALSQISDNIQSQSLNESVRFFMQASRSGGKVAQLLENTSNDLRRTQDLKRELESSTKTYVIFVGFVMVVATPLLMAVSVAFVELITKIQSQASLSGGDATAAGLGFLGGTLSITPAFLEGMAFVLLVGNAVLAGLFMGMIGQNKPLLGLRFTLPMLLASAVIFMISRVFLAGLLGVV